MKNQTVRDPKIRDPSVAIQVSRPVLSEPLQAGILLALQVDAIVP
jgi:hypothetical protein